MKKIIKINGMNCGHCKAAVEKELNALEGVQATVDLQNKQALVTLDTELADELFESAIDEAGFEMVSIENLL